MSENKALEEARCAQINFDNLVKAAPMLAMHPFYKIARHQLDCAVAMLSGEPEPEFPA